MAIRFVCPLGHLIKAADHRAGKKGRCPVCHQKVIVPVPNPRPSGREKRSWDAPGGSPIEIDDKAAPPSDPPLASGAAIPSRRKRRRRSPSRRSATTAPMSFQPPAPPEALASPPIAPAHEHAGPPGTRGFAGPAFPGPTIGDSAALTPLPPPPAAVPTPPTERIAVPPKPAAGRWGLRPERPPRWVGWMRAELGPYIDRPDARQVEVAYWLAAVLVFCLVFGAAPALRHWQLADAPAWAQLMLLVAAGQLAYTAWLVVLPDASTVWVGMILFALVAAGYAAVMLLVASASPGEPLPLGLTGAGASAAGWCGANVAVMGLVSFACGRLATTWRRRLTASRTW